MPPLVITLVFNRIRNARMLFFARPIAKAIADKVLGTFIVPNIQRQLAYIEGELANEAWFAGRAFTAADVMMSFPLEAAAAAGYVDARMPNIAGFLERIHERPAYRRALDAGGPYQLI
jgi:glutathione S-transferase